MNSMADSTVEKTIDPTAYRREQARREGRVALSHDLSSTVAFVLAILLLLALGKGVVDLLASLMQHQLGQAGALVANQSMLIGQFQGLMVQVARIVLPLIGLVALAAAAGNVLQVGFLFTPSRILPDLGRVNPFQGMQRIASLRGTARFGFGLVKIAVVGAVGGMVLWNGRGDILRSAALDLPVLAQFIADTLFRATLWVSIALLSLAIVDYGFQRWKHEQDLKLTPQELREELKMLEGNPLVKKRQRQLQRL
jgi:flagellar biosynthetic protein FlhB